MYIGFMFDVGRVMDDFVGGIVMHIFFFCLCFVVQMCFSSVCCIWDIVML